MYVVITTKKEKRVEIFKDLSDCEIKEVLDCLNAENKYYEKNETIFEIGDRTECLGIVKTGSVVIERDDIWGNRSIIGLAESGDIFAESYALQKEVALLVRARAREKSEVIFLNVNRLLDCGSPVSKKVIKNLLILSSGKNLMLSKRIIYTSQKTIRSRLMAYLSDKSREAGSLTFDIPFDRQMLSDYLNVDRSAMSAEVSKLQKEGYLSAKKNHFRLFVKDSDYI